MFPFLFLFRYLLFPLSFLQWPIGSLVVSYLDFWCLCFWSFFSFHFAQFSVSNFFVLGMLVISSGLGEMVPYIGNVLWGPPACSLLITGVVCSRGVPCVCCMRPFLVGLTPVDTLVDGTGPQPAWP